MAFELVVERKEGDKKSVPLKRFPVLVGRHTECAICIASKAVSRKHCQIDQRDGWLVVQDLGSSNGTTVNNVTITEPVTLQPGDKLEIGPISFLVNYPAPPSVPPLPVIAAPESFTDLFADDSALPANFDDEEDIHESDLGKSRQPNIAVTADEFISLDPNSQMDPELERLFAELDADQTVYNARAPKPKE